MSGQTTYCPKCKTAVIVRDWHSVLSHNLNKDCCKNCGTKIAGFFG